jgi:rubredoxin
LFDFPDDSEMPHAILNSHTGNIIGQVHFHKRDQFQVVVDGRFRIGRHACAPYSVHYARAYTPYGPLVPDAGGNYTFVAMRAHRDVGAQYVSKELDQLRAIPDRRPWQITRPAVFPPRESANVVLHPLPDMNDDDGLAVYTISMQPNTKTSAPDPSHGEGQYLLVVKGGLWHDKKVHKALTLIFVKPDEGAYQLHAGDEGLQAIVLNFPQVKRSQVRITRPAVSAPRKNWQCVLCAFTYDEALGIPEEGIPAGTRWTDVPDTWTCPDCSANKSDFQTVEV